MLKSIGKQSGESDFVLEKKKGYGGKKKAPELWLLRLYKKLSYRRGTAQCVVPVEILPIATQQCSTTSPEQMQVMKLQG